ncbi:hypothetical protein OG897_05720 [Streptomyces sp. NBC_00237]|uniref:hypothetical protein n=1 Tax=Streptomyces sp. NBC_00237 TaxID=2975687 RepID=UPI0022533742|nr:hypothetical protein [Streptomyces sp. NBC_00237]MCX5200960.1 hypothetical protein [Streptomyces sp. NBC_00237]
MMAYAPIRIAEFLAELGDASYQLHDTSSLWFLIKSVQSVGDLWEVTVYPLVSTGSRDDAFLVGVEVAANVVATSAPVQWSEVAPPLGAYGEEAVMYVLSRIEEIVEVLKMDYCKAVNAEKFR